MTRPELDGLARRQVIWAYRQWALALMAERGPSLVAYLKERPGYLSKEDVRLALALMTEHCVIASVASTNSSATRLRGGLSEVGHEFNGAVDVLDGAMRNLTQGRESALIDDVLWVEQTGWLAVGSTMGVYGSAGLLPMSSPVLICTADEERSHSVVGHFLSGMAVGRVSSSDALALVRQVIEASTAVSSLHYRASEFVRINPRWEPVWAN